MIKRLAFLFILVLSAGIATAGAQTPNPQANPPTANAPAGTAVSQTPDDDDAVLDPAEPDFVLVNLPTTMRLPLHKGNFRLTHRFSGNLRAGSFSQNASNLFGLDQGAIIGFEYRVAIARHLQAAVFRTNFSKTFQFYGKYDAIHQHGTTPLSVSAIVSVEGTNNFQENYAPALGIVLSRMVAERVAIYATPIWVGNTAASQLQADKQSTFFVGLGTRLRLSKTVYAVGELSPRISGYKPDDVEYGFGIEKRVGGHAFQLTFTNTFGTTFAQLARGGAANSLYLGFNLGRKFF